MKERLPWGGRRMAMNCVDAEGLFDAYLDGELSGTLRLEFDTHRLHCAVCQQKLSLLETTEYVVSTDLRGPSLSDDFTDKLMASLEQRKMAPRPIKFRRPLMAAAAVLQAAAVLAFVLYLPRFWTYAPSSSSGAARTTNLADLRAKIDGAMASTNPKENLIAVIREEAGNARAGIVGDVSSMRDWASSFDLPGFGNGVSVTSLLQSIFAITPPDSNHDRTSNSSGSL